MENPSQIILGTLRNDIIEYNLQIKAIIQDIVACNEELAQLQLLNSAGRSKISSLRKFIDRLGDIAKENKDPNLLKDVVSYREQLTSTMEAFKKANIDSMLMIETKSKQELLTSNQNKNEQETGLKRRQKGDKESLVKRSSNVTDQLFSISRQLADTTKRSADTLDALMTSSDTVTGTQEELKMTSTVIHKSSKLLDKYGRREFTDKILMFLAFAFFIACVLYIVQKRLF